MQNKSSALFIIFVTACVILMGLNNAYPQGYKSKPDFSYKRKKQAEIYRLQKKIEADPDDLASHEKYIELLGVSNPILLFQYKRWMHRYPKSVNVVFALAEGYYDKELPQARKYLLQTLSLNSKLAIAWEMLAMDADSRGDKKSFERYIKKATDIEPENADYAYYYAMGLKDMDTSKWRAMILDLVRRFPENKRGALGLFWLADKSADTTDKISLFEMLKRSYPPKSFSYSMAGMEELFNIYLITSKEKAIQLAKEMHFKTRTNFVQNLIVADSLVAQKNYYTAVELLKQTKIQVDSLYTEYDDLLILKEANINYLSGNIKAGYDSLIHRIAIAPTNEMFKTAKIYGKKLGKSETGINNDIWEYLNKTAKQVVKFRSKLYTENKWVSINDYKGKVILLTFWFPQCGPCKAEFPHFEKVLNEFNRKQIEYLGINVYPEQDNFVLSFVKNSKVTFTPLHGTTQFETKAFGINSQPANFLIDQNGEIIFSNFDINADNEDTLKLMIELLLRHSS